MKKIILNFKRTIRFLVSIIVSSEFAFIYVLLGTISQVAHTYFLLENISSLEGNWKIFQSVMLSIFISSSLLYWVAISDKDDKTDEGIKNFKRANFAVWLFTIIEIFINIYYYSKHLVIDKKEYQIYEFIFALMIACLIPLTIKLFSSNIRSKYWILEFEDNDIVESSNDETNSLSEEKLLEFIQPMITNFEDSLKEIQDVNQEKIDELINKKLVTLNEDIDKQISDSYLKNQDLFLKQFENKAKVLSNNYLENLKTKI